MELRNLSFFLSLQEYMLEFVSKAIKSGKFGCIDVFRCYLEEASSCDFDKIIKDRIKFYKNLLFGSTTKFRTNHDKICKIKDDLFKAKSVIQQIDKSKFIKFVGEIAEDITFDVRGGG